MNKGMMIVLTLAVTGFGLGSTLPGHAAPWMGNLTIRDDQVWPAGRPGNYGVVHYFVDEARNEEIPFDVSVEVYADGHAAQDLEVQVFSNVNRRDQAKVWESHNDAGGPTSYYMTYTMRHVGPAGTNELYKTTLRASRTGAYRLTARYRIGNGPWLWHNDFDADGRRQRDCAMVISPRKVLNLAFYEANPLVVEAEPGGTAQQHSTFEDFTDHDHDGYDPFHLSYIRQTLGFNALWLMPIFPNTRDRLNSQTGQRVENFSPGSPYAARDYWSVSEQLSEAGTPEAALREFKYMVSKAEALELDVFIDVALNHAGRDVIFGQGAVDLGFLQANGRKDIIATTRPAWSTSRSNYRAHAKSKDDLPDYAPADRLGEHQWYDAGMDWYFGDYSSLGPKPGRGGDTSQGSAEDERDLFYTDLDPSGGHDFEVERVWNYFAYLLPYWLTQTDNRLDGIRADFSQGLPPQAWEYIVNKTRQKKWDFVFLAEALDPDPIRYRVSRTFDLLTTLDHCLYRKESCNDHTKEPVKMSHFVGSLEQEATIYGYNAAVLHNGTSHDEDGNTNAWVTVARYAVAASLSGSPMVFMGQPLGVGHKVDFQESWQSISSYWNHDNTKIFDMYRRINQARAQNPALRSTHRYFLNRQQSGAFNEAIFSAARWDGKTDANVVLVFVNLRNQGLDADTFAVPRTVPLQNQTGVRYQARNLLADDPGAPLWPAPRTAEDIFTNGVYVKLDLPNEVQYLRLERVP